MRRSSIGCCGRRGQRAMAMATSAHERRRGTRCRARRAPPPSATARRRCRHRPSTRRRGNRSKPACETAPPRGAPPHHPPPSRPRRAGGWRRSRRQRPSRTARRRPSRMRTHRRGPCAAARGAREGAAAPHQLPAAVWSVGRRVPASGAQTTRRHRRCSAPLWAAPAPRPPNSRGSTARVRTVRRLRLHRRHASRAQPLTIRAKKLLVRCARLHGGNSWH